ncbi:MAG: GNAT family N-acetyltransferase [Diaphorobacter nitroreducens]|uniref:GNAT family N-acetyltransferase n=1 Tax=Diaphorobacter nitroreducens TaxID=164759 RepID=UPI003C745F4F
MPAEADALLALHTHASSPQDMPFLRSLFASRCDHLHALGLPPPALQALIDQQYACREADYLRRFPQAHTRIALVGDECVGSLVVYDDNTTLHIVDLVVAPSVRGRGHGRTLVQQVQSQAHTAGRQAVTLSVDPMNQSALRLYLTLGFQVTEKQPVQWRMLWRPCPRDAQEDAHAGNLSLPTTTKG